MISKDIRGAPAPREIATALGLSLSRFYDLFRKETGTVPARYVRSLRYLKARELLISSQFSVKEITHLVGLHDVSHFVRDFQRIYGASPTQFRRLYTPSPASAKELGERSQNFNTIGTLANKS
jgi:AraC-like DNA-binding protein